MAIEKNALISVANKVGIVDFAANLRVLDWNIFASGNTAKTLDAGGVDVTDISDIVGPPILGDRVKTLSREVHAGLLANYRKTEDLEELEALGIPYLGLVAIDMYDLRRAINDGLTEAEIIEKTDVGGPTMLHSAAKGRRIVVSKSSQREPVLKWLHDERPDEENVLRTLAAVAEQEVSAYIGESARYLAELAFAQEPLSEYADSMRAA